jgi:NAD(P)-dependent dehydrogenase (short-subunit alcohol dehydrogenase family)
MRVCVIDGQGGGIGAAIIRRLKEVYQEEHEVIALGTNAVATAQMMKARANRGASGENAIVRTVPLVDIILGPLSIVLANAMMGELTPRMAEAISSSPAPKLLLPLTQEQVEIVGLSPEPLPHLVEKIISERLKEYMRHV